MKNSIDCLIIIQYKYIYWMAGMDSDQNNIDQLSQNYREMNETGKEKLKEVSEKIFEIWKSKKETNTNEK